MAANNELAMDQLKKGSIFAQDNIDDLIVLRAALDVLEYSATLTPDEKENVINNARVALSGVKGYIHGTKGL